MKNLLIILLMLSTCVLNAQIKLSAQLINSETKKPIEFASVLILDVYEGTITDTLGNFELEVENENQLILIQSLGYTSDTFSVKEIKENPLLSLSNKGFEIENVVVLPRNAFEIMRESVAKIPDNYHASTIAQNVYYKQKIIANNEILSFEEANFDALVKYKNENANIVSVKKARAIIDLDTLKSLGKMVAKQFEDFDSINIKENASQFFAMNFMLSDEIGSTSKAFFGEKGYKNYKYSYNGLVEKDGYYVYHITFDQLDDIKKSLYKGHFYIDTASLAFTNIQIYLSPKGIEYQKVIPKSVIIIAKLLGYTIYIKGMNYNVDYKELDGKWHLKYADSKLSAKVSKRNGASFDGFLEMKFDVNKFYLKEGFYNKKSKYDELPSNLEDFKNESFWNGLKYIPLSKREEALIRIK